MELRSAISASTVTQSQLPSLDVYCNYHLCLDFTTVIQGEFAWRNLQKDGFVGRAPIGSFPANGYGW
jgi:hypothetical protein